MLAYKHAIIVTNLGIWLRVMAPKAFVKNNLMINMDHLILLNAEHKM